MKIAFLFMTFLLIASCSSTETEQRDRAGVKFTVVCRDEVQDCYDKANSLCPDGYLVSNRVRGRKIGENTLEYRVVIQCRRKRIYP